MKQERRSTQRFLVEGRRLKVAEISAIYGVSKHEFWQRVNRLGWTPLKAATQPLRQPPTYSIDGRKLTRTQIHRLYDVHPTVFTRRLKAGRTPTEAVRMGPGVRKYQFRGRRLTITQAAKRWGIPRDTIKARLLKGWSPDRAVEPLVKAPRHRIHGEWLTAREIEARYKVSRQLFNLRIKKGWSATRAATDPHGSQTYKVNGEWLDRQAIADKYGISPKQFGHRLTKLGWSPQRAATTPITTAIRIKVHGELLTYREIHDRFGVEQSLFRMRRKRGLTPEQAVDTPVKRARFKTAGTVRVAGKKITVREAAALIENVSAFGIRERLRRGVPEEQAVMEPSKRPRRDTKMTDAT